MKKLLWGSLLALAFGLTAAQAQADKKEEAKDTKPAAKEVAVLKTAEGELVIEFWADVAPKTVANFKKLAQSGFYDGTAFHRIVKGFMIQGGDQLTKDEKNEARFGTGDPGYKIKAEFSDRHHVRGVISMARSRDPDSAGSQFFICLGEASFLDGKYTAFGKLIKGEDVLLKLGDTPVGPSPSGENSKPLKRVGLESVKIVPADSIK
ncbi:MAG: peptidylprolyl isomerase [Verrucomicrobiota bacterium]|jgi:peptidyl-prolyl cis-trans isomerase B (cyclophilin B)